MRVTGRKSVCAMRDVVNGVMQEVKSNQKVYQ